MRRGFTKNNSLFIPILFLLGAIVIWVFAFVVEYGNFWLKLPLGVSILAVSSFAISRREDRTSFALTARSAIIGVVSAAVLYGIFLLGNELLIILFPTAEEQIAAVHRNKEALPLGLIAVLLFFVSSPGEEIFWRAYIQRRLQRNLGSISGLVVGILCYAGVHLFTGNPSLVLAALVAGAFWGIMYHIEKDIITVIVSHSFWTLLVFVLFPIGA
ncbi:MAG: type II CAAX endopeptidase family protein [Alkalispirochaeta sp.]